jgi:hypothetical protein
MLNGTTSPTFSAMDAMAKGGGTELFVLHRVFGNLLSNSNGEDGMVQGVTAE